MPSGKSEPAAPTKCSPDLHLGLQVAFGAYRPKPQGVDYLPHNDVGKPLRCESASKSIDKATVMCTKNPE
jgi:hypothetical protein